MGETLFLMHHQHFEHRKCWFSDHTEARHHLVLFWLKYLLEDYLKSLLPVQHTVWHFETQEIHFHASSNAQKHFQLKIYFSLTTIAVSSLRLWQYRQFCHSHLRAGKCPWRKGQWRLIFHPGWNRGLSMLRPCHTCRTRKAPPLSNPIPAARRQLPESDGCGSI